MRTLSIDIETYSSVDLTKSGVYPYVESPDFEILLFAYAFDDSPVHIIDIAQGERLPQEVESALTDSNTEKRAFNANFEITCINAFFGFNLPVEQWVCTMTHALMLGLPGSLAEVARVLKASRQKMTEGKALINYFSKPCKPTKTNGERCRNQPFDNIEKWELFKDYCKQDVETERAIKEKISFYEIPVFERKLWALDQKINNTGVLTEEKLVVNAIECNTYNIVNQKEEAIKITGLENPNSVTQLKIWLEGKTGKKLKSLTKEDVSNLLEDDIKPEVKRVLTLRQEMSKTSVKKYQAMLEARCADNRIRGLLQYYGANRSGRWAGRIVQVQNLPQNHLPDLDEVRTLLCNKAYDDIKLIYGSVSGVLSQLVRTAFIAEKGSRFIVADFSAIEARVIAWLAGEKWRMDVFSAHGKIYEASAAQMFNVPVGTITKGSSLRQKGKIAELALGYGGSVGALVSMGALKMGIPEEELPELVEAWRTSNLKIVRLWKNVELAAIKAIEERQPVKLEYGVKFFYTKGILFITLPSGRKLSYTGANVGKGKFGGKAVTYKGVNQTSKKWETIDTFGGKLVENIIQAIARDCLAEALIRLDSHRYRIIMHVHDEAVLEVPEGVSSAAEISEIMGKDIEWAPGLPLRADAYETYYYKKD